MLLFETERLRVQRFTAADADVFFRINGDAELVKYIRPAKNRADSDAFLQENLNLYQNGSLVGRFAVFAKENNLFLGTFSFLFLSDRENFHIGYALLKEARGKGYATELVKEGSVYFFRNKPNDVLYAITETANEDSQKVLLRAGLVLKGKIIENDKLLDLFQLSRNQVTTC